MSHVLVEFAGTEAEARAFAIAERVVFHAAERTEPNGFPYLSLPFASPVELAEAQQRFRDLGWELEHQEVRL
jgi:hypothetical protein